MPPSKTPVAVICGASPTGLAVARALGRNSVPVGFADFDAARPGFASRYCDSDIDPIVADTPEALCGRLIAVAERLHQRPVLFQTSDEMVLVVARHRERLEAHFAIAGSVQEEEAARFVNKRRFYEFCAAEGIPTPRTSFPSTTAELDQLLIHFEFPLLLKPIIGHLWRRRLRGRKLLVVRSPDHLRRVATRLGSDLRGLMVQELIPGTEDQLWVAGVFSDENGSVRRCFVGRKLRQYPGGFGSASLAVSDHNPAVRELSHQVVAQSGYRGICGIEFKRDPRDGILKIIEINPRPTLWFGLIESSGVDLIHSAYSELASLPLGPEPSQVDGRRWLYFEKDLVTACKYMCTGRLSPWAYLASLRHVTTHAIASRDDFRPLAASLLYYIRRLVHRVCGNTRRAAQITTDERDIRQADATVPQAELGSRL